MKIPKKIWQIWLGKDNPVPTEWLDTFKKLYSDWDYELITDDNIPRLVNRKIFETENRYHTKGNLLRYELIYKYGGIHFDADMIALRKLDDEILDNDFFCCYESEQWSNGLIPSCAFGARPNHPILKELVYNMRKQDQSKHSWQFNGTQYFTDTINNYQGKKKIYPSYFFNPIHFRDDRESLESRKRLEVAYTDHLWYSSKNKWRTPYGK